MGLLLGCVFVILGLRYGRISLNILYNIWAYYSNGIFYIFNLLGLWVLDERADTEDNDE